MVDTRVSCRSDAAVLARLDLASWSSAASPAAPPSDPDAYSCFSERTSYEDVIVADAAGTAVGYVALERPTPLASNAHVLMIGGLAVDPGYQRRGIGKLLVDAAIRESARRRARKLGLRVLRTNPAAQRLYERCGFIVEGVLCGEFLLDNRYVDDVLMAWMITDDDAQRASVDDTS